MRYEEWKSRNGTTVSHAIYTKEEADLKGIEYKSNWREGTVGDWVLTDDGCVVEVLRGGSDQAGRSWIGTCTMTTSTARTTTLNTEKKENRYSFNGKCAKLPKNLTAELMAFCVKVAKGEDPVDAYMSTVSAKSRGGHSKQFKRYVQNRVSKLMSHPPIRNQINSEISELCKEAGISKIWLLRRYKGAAEQTENFSAAVSAMNKISEFVGLKAESNEGEMLPAIGTEKVAGYLSADAVVVEEDPRPDTMNDEVGGDVLKKAVEQLNQNRDEVSQEKSIYDDVLDKAEGE